MSQDRELAVIDSIYDAMDAGDFKRALTLAREGLAVEDDPVLRFLAGVTLAYLDRPADAAKQLRLAVDLDPDDADFRAELALALFRCCQFDDAREQVDHALALNETHADGHYVRALLLEREGRLDESDRHFRAAADLDGERFADIHRVDWAEFDRQIDLARDRLPAEFRKHLEHVGLIVEDLPPDELLFESTPPLDPELLGLFVGVPLDQQSHFGTGGELPARIYLFKRNLERLLEESTQLAGEIADTLYHELGHYLGMDEDDLKRLDFA